MPFSQLVNTMSAFSPPVFDFSGDFDFHFQLPGNHARTTASDSYSAGSAIDFNSTSTSSLDAQPALATKQEETDRRYSSDGFKDELDDIVAQARQDSGDLSAWDSTQDLMQIILDEDLANSNFYIRLDDDVNTEANKESLLDVFGVDFIVSGFTNVTAKGHGPSSTASSTRQRRNISMERRHGSS